ncbi:hypothetical protein AO378_0164 [Moraxella catarrhalis]|nr:hypothetical protein AO378_0164 [Moraxella catarrhalis]
MVIEINPNDEFAYITHFIQKINPKLIFIKIFWLLMTLA